MGLAEPIRYAGGNAELTVSEISDSNVRIVLTPLDEKAQPRAAPPSSSLVELQPKLKFQTRELSGAVEVPVGKLRVKIEPGPLRITVTGSAGKVVQELVFAGDDGSMKFRLNGPVLGLGEGAKQFDRIGARYRMINGQIAPFLETHGATIPVPFLVGTGGWAMLVHGPWGEFDLSEPDGRFTPRPGAAGKEPLQVFVIGLDQPADALAEYIRLTGRPVMPPKWTMGYMQSHRTLAGSKEPVEIVRTFRDKKLPIDAVIYLGTGYCPAGWNLGHGTLDFNPKTFDRPSESIKALHDEHVKVVLHVNHAPKSMFGNSVTEKSDDPKHISNYWARHKKVLALGVDAWWPDDGDELPIEARLARHRCYFEGSLLDRPSERPWALHRNGYAGVQRYGGWIWSGDTQSRWDTLAAHVPVALNHSLSLTPFWGSDIGGFVPTKELTGELYVRWFQFGAFNPLFRSHGRTWKLRLPFGWNTGEFGPIESRERPDASELRNAEVEPICKKYLELRYRLLPYNYTLMREACDTGLPPMRALWLHHADDPEAVKLGDEYLWGRDLLVAPVVHKSEKSRRLYLPAGDWYDWWTGERLTGQRWIDRPVDLATLPFYVRAGAIIPLDPVRQYTAQEVKEPTTLQVYRGAAGQYVLYDDDGTSRDYLRGKCSWTKVTWNDAAKRLTIEPDSRNSSPGGQDRVFDIVLLPENTRHRVAYKGMRVEAGF
jgi:alpha-glucosidase/alpha-D-xyloside xylohydrolase